MKFGALQYKFRMPTTIKYVRAYGCVRFVKRVCIKLRLRRHKECIKLIDVTFCIPKMLDQIQICNEASPLATKLNE